MKYSLEFKMECVQKYINGEYISTPEKTKNQRNTFLRHVRCWAKTMIKEYALIKNNSSKSIRIESNKLLNFFIQLKHLRISFYLISTSNLSAVKETQSPFEKSNFLLQYSAPYRYSKLIVNPKTLIK